MKIKQVARFSWYTLLYSVPTSIVSFERVRIGQDTRFTRVSLFGISLGIYQEKE